MNRYFLILIISLLYHPYLLTLICKTAYNLEHILVHQDLLYKKTYVSVFASTVVSNNKQRSAK